jgi:hypothetical protein
LRTFNGHSHVAVEDIMSVLDNANLATVESGPEECDRLPPFRLVFERYLARVSRLRLYN